MNAATTILRNITPFDEIALEIDDLYAEAAHWADGTPIETQAQCDALDALDKSLMDAGKRLDALRVEEKRPLDEQVQAIQDRYNPFIQPKKGKVDLARSALNPLRAAWKERERLRKEEAARKERAEAEAIKAEAERLMRESAGNLEARADAEHMLNSAKLAEAGAKKLEKAASTGNGLRAAHKVAVTDLNAAVRHYWPTHKAHFEALIYDLAAEDVRSGARTIPGITVTEEKRAI